MKWLVGFQEFMAWGVGREESDGGKQQVVDWLEVCTNCKTYDGSTWEGEAMYGIKKWRG